MDMYWFFRLLLTGLTMFNVCFAEEEEDEYPWIDSYTISYGGISFECTKGCGDPFYNPGMETIDSMFYNCLEKTVGHPSPALWWLFPNGMSEKLWEREDICKYSVMNWQRGKNKAKIQGYDTFLLDSYSRLPVVIERFYKDLGYNHIQSLSVYNEKIKEKKSILETLVSLKKDGCLSIDYDPDGKMLGNHYAGGYSIDIDEAIESAQEKLKEVENDIESEHEEFHDSIEIAEETFREIDEQFKKIFIRCLNNHQPEGIAFNSALENFLLGDIDGGVAQIRELIQTAEECELGDDLIAKLYFLKGEIQAEGSLYADAIADLTTAIQKMPSMKEAYLERAASYFELGKFDQSIQDYLSSGIRPTYDTNPTDWGLGISAGLFKGAGQSVADFIPSSLVTLRGLGNGLWTFVKSPVGASRELIESTKKLIELLQSNSAIETLQEIVPELKELIQNNNKLSDFRKGELVGLAIGKYGVDIFLAKYGTTAIKAYRELKQANQLMTLEALATPQKTQTILSEANKRWAHREQVLKNATLNIQWDKLGKHMEGH